MRIQQNMDVQNSLYMYQTGVKSASKSNTNNKSVTAKEMGLSQISNGRSSIFEMGLSQISKGRNSTIAEKSGLSNFFYGYTNRQDEDKTSVSNQMRQMIRDLKQEQNKEVQTQKDKMSALLGLSGTTETEEEEVVAAPKYNYKAVATKIQQAKTSLSAGQAVLAAKRETLKIRKLISAGQGDPEELQIALTHAKRMEMVARKKKHHIELEELVAYTQKADENAEKMEDAAVQMKDALVMAQEEKVEEQEDNIFEEREAMLRDVLEQLEENEKAFSEEELADINEMISEFGEEELEELEKNMEMLETMEVVDPHMSKEDFEDLKRKHRASEDKAIVKANMEYLKDMIKHELQKSASVPGIRSNGSSGGGAVPMAPRVTSSGIAESSPFQGMDVSVPSAQIDSSPAINIQL